MRTDAGLQSWAINTDKDVKDGSAEQATFDIWHENVMETNHVYLQTVAWCRAWGTYPRSQWEVAAGNASWEIAVPLVKRLKRAAARYTSIRRYADRLVSYAYAYECPPTRVRNTLPTRRSSRAHAWAVVRRHWLNELGTTRLCTTRLRRTQLARLTRQSRMTWAYVTGRFNILASSFMIYQNCHVTRTSFRHIFQWRSVGALRKHVRSKKYIRIAKITKFT